MRRATREFASLVGGVRVAGDDRGELRKANTRLAAAQFLAVIVGDLQLRLAMGLAPASRAEQRNVVKAGVDMFIRAYQPDGK